jgi:hypothetical protein
MFTVYTSFILHVIFPFSFYYTKAKGQNFTDVSKCKQREGMYKSQGLPNQVWVVAVGKEEQRWFGFVHKYLPKLSSPALSQYKLFVGLKSHIEKYVFFCVGVGKGK